MKQRNIFAIAIMAGALILSGCASKKDLDNCRMENDRLSTDRKSVV